MAEPNGTRLERLQAGQDRLLRYAHFRLGEELMKSQLGASNLPTGPSSPGIWDVEYSEGQAEALGLESNSYDTFTRQERDESSHSGSLSKVIKGKRSGDGESTMHMQSIMEHQSSVLPTESSHPRLEVQQQPDELLSSVLSTTSSKIHFDESSILSTDDSQSQTPSQQPLEKSETQKVQQSTTLIESQSDSALYQNNSSSVMSTSLSAANINTRNGLLNGGQSTQSKVQPSVSEELLSKADSAIQFFMKRSQIIDPPVQNLLNQVHESEKKKIYSTLSSVLRPPPSHSYGTKKGYQKSVQRKKRQRKAKIMKSREMMQRQISELGSNIQIKNSFRNNTTVFRSTSSLREIIDSKPQRKQPRKLAALAHKSISGNDCSSSGSNNNTVGKGGESSIDSSVESSTISLEKDEQIQPRLLNSHLKIPNGKLTICCLKILQSLV
jgi:hypothetical protein